jgi:uncharacterized protein DUF6883
LTLPNAERAVVDIAKLRDYCLSATHPLGKHKARVFASVLGLTDADAEELREALQQAARMLDATPGEQDEYGQRYTIDFIMVGPTGQVTVRSGWIVRTGEEFARLTTCYVL